MVEPVSPRYVVIRGPTTAVRLALPALGSVTFGKASGNDWCLDAPGIADEHVVLYLDEGVGLEALDPRTAFLVNNERGAPAQRPITPGKSIDLADGAWVQIGSLELAVGPISELSPGRRAWCRSYLERRIAAAVEAGQGESTAVVRLKAPGAEVEAVLGARLRSNDLLGELGGGEWALVLFGVTEPEAQAMVTGIARELGQRGLSTELGLVMALEVEPAALLQLAAERTVRQGPATGARRFHRSSHPAMERLQRLIEQVGPTEAHVLIVGETGVGKEVVVQQLHHTSARASRPLLRLNAVELTDQLLDNPRQFFGRVAGSTVLLDEVAGLSPRAQLALGELVEDSSAQAHGVRFLATSNQDLGALAGDGAFRKDLYFRLNRVTLSVPPLRERISDVMPLAELFLESAGKSGAKISLAARERLESYGWPGNVRELRSTIERAALAAGSGPINLEHLPNELAADDSPVPEAQETTATAGSSAAEAPARGSLREEMLALEKRRILEALEKYPTQTEAAKALDIPLRTFLNRLDALGIPRARKKE